ncbi:RICIN domain-containing protein [Chitinophaga pinensis]|uniref:Ricin B lectin domain-containing protein n=1 Tax=Chitinophaga pinensis (strain ATCC 43595 / DSM 2588 / LMG 13176 / NBRC 15968 / NCIMB 11800 / UQM 2034) TaxID=485918 RepID=A0A979GAD8_CHIPD|nr:RICIN domain-containing protein [Chitinophaga pinensis]ACU63718.1 hypothetical protein Cpin_6313 [Chitinophaga pinensis DSM 2588]
MKNLHTLWVTAMLNIIAVNAFAQTIKGTFAIQNVQTGIYLRIKDADTRNGTPIVAYTPVNWKCVTWDFHQVNGDTYELKNLFSGKTMQPVDEKPSAGTTLEEQPMTAGKSSQQYEFIPVDKGTYLIRVKGSDLYLTPADNNGTVNAKILLAKKNNSKLQQWTIHEQQPAM